MSWILQNLWLIPVLPLMAAGISALLKRPNRSLSAGLAIGALGTSFLLSVRAFAMVARRRTAVIYPFREPAWK